MRVRLIVALLVVASLTGFAPVPKPRPAREPDPKETAKNMQGTWQVVSSEIARAKGKASSSLTRQVQITGSTWQYIYISNAGALGRPLPSTSYNIALDPSKSPVAMDLKRATNDSVYMSGIVSVEGDTMKFCYVLGARLAAGDATGRPAAFDPIPDGAVLMTLKRVKP